MALAGLADHPAAQACRSLGAAWYLPARLELNVIYENIVDQDGDDTPGGPLGSTFGFTTTGIYPLGSYVTSTETSSTRANHIVFSNGMNRTDLTKTNAFSVRCVRRD